MIWPFTKPVPRKEPPKMIHLTHNAWLKLRYAAQFDPKMEVGGFGKTEVDLNGDVLVTDIIIPPQIIQASHTDIQPADLVKFNLALMERGEIWMDWRLWWHSHQSMGTTPSGQDEETLRAVARELGDWAVGMVISSNPGTEWYGWCVINQPIFTRNKLDVKALPYEDQTIKDEIAEMFTRVEKKTYAAPTYQKPAAQVNAGGGNTGGAAKHRPAGAPSILARTANGKTLGEMTEAEFKAWIDDTLPEITATQEALAALPAHSPNGTVPAVPVGAGSAQPDNDAYYGTE